MRTEITKYALLLSLAAGLSSVSTALGAHDDSTSTTGAATTKLSKKASAFLKEAARDNQLEMALADLGSRKAQNSELKQFSEQIKQDHSQVAQQIQPIAQKYGVALDQHEKQKEVTKLEKETGAEFDKKYAELMLKTHQQNIEKFHNAATEVEEADVKQFAQSTLPKLHQHFQHAERVATMVGVDQNTISSYSRKVSTAMGGTSDVPEGSSGSSTEKGSGANQLKAGERHSDH
jgi:putative membrane protein